MCEWLAECVRREGVGDRFLLYCFNCVYTVHTTVHVYVNIYMHVYVFTLTTPPPPPPHTHTHRYWRSVTSSPSSRTSTPKWGRSVWPSGQWWRREIPSSRRLRRRYIGKSIRTIRLRLTCTTSCYRKTPSSRSWR